MTTKWPIQLLGSVAEDITVGFVGTMSDEYVQNGVRFLRSQDVVPYRILTDDNKFIGQDFHKRLTKSRLSEGDVVIVRTGKPGTCAVIPRDLGECNCSDLVIVRPGTQIDPRYLCYFINGVAANHVMSWTVGAVQQHFNVGAAREMPIPLPAIAEQRRIAEILGALDDKIELNRRMNATLEEMARALFRSWFVDFDPVKVKARGGDPTAELGLAPETAALFPNSFQDSPLGPIPNGWTASTVGQEFTFVMGPSPPGDTYNSDGEGMPFYQGKSDYGYRFPSRRIYCSAPTRFADPGDSLVSVRAPVGALNMSYERCAIGRGLASVQHHSYSGSLTYYAMHSLSAELAVYEEGGTVFGSITKQGFQDLPFVAPPHRLIQSYEKVVGEIDRQMRLHEEQSVTLGQTRDFLLPRLLSGTIAANQALAAAQT